MANEICIEEWTKPAYGYGSSIGGKLVTTQFIDYGALSAQLNSETDYVVVQNLGASTAYIKQGGSSVSAAVDTAGSLPLAAGTRSDPLPASPGLDYIDNAT